MKREKKNRILNIDTSLRDPKRVKDFLEILFTYNNKILNKEIAEEVEKELIMKGFYRPQKLNVTIPDYREKLEFDEEEAKTIMNKFPQDHNQLGMKGWGGRFGTHYHNMIILGYCYLKLGEKIKFGESGTKLVKLNHEEEGKISQIHLNAVAHWQTDNPKVNNLNRNKHLSLILRLIKLFVKKTKKGILYREIPIILCWKNNNEEELFNFLQLHRERINSRIRITKDKIDEITLQFCSQIFNDEWNGIDKEGKIKLSGTKTKITTILKDYPDSFFRYLRHTTLIFKKRESGNSFIYFDQKQENKINYIIEKYSELKNFENLESYFEYVSKLDPELYDDDIIEILSDNTHLEKFIKEIGKENIKNQLLSLGSGNKISKNEILKDIEPSLRLEWLISLFSYSETKDNIKKIKPNYHVNSDGQAIRHANGMSMKHSGADAVVYENNSFFTLEPTLLTGTVQYLKESPSTHRHLKKELEFNERKVGYCLQISPDPFFDTKQYAKHEPDFNLIPISIKDFVKKIEETKSFKKAFGELAK